MWRLALRLGLALALACSGTAGLVEGKPDGERYRTRCARCMAALGAPTTLHLTAPLPPTGRPTYTTRNGRLPGRHYDTRPDLQSSGTSCLLVLQAWSRRHPAVARPYKEAQPAIGRPQQPPAPPSNAATRVGRRRRAVLGCWVASATENGGR